MTNRFGIAALLATLVLAGCGGGAQTTENPVGSGDTGGGINTAIKAPYTGPAPRDADVQNFRLEFWENARGTDRCGSCHTPEGGQMPYFVRWDDVNLAYDEAVLRIDRDQPSGSPFVTKVSALPIGHNCWVDDPGTCGSILTTWIENWIDFSSAGGRAIMLTAPDDASPDDSKNFPDDTTLFEEHLWREDRLKLYCSNCHSSDAATPQQPYFADVDSVQVAYEAVKSKIDLDSPDNSRLVIRVRDEFHNCWNNDCVTSGTDMLSWVTAFANGIEPTQINAELITSRAIRLVDGIIASGGNRYENDQIALWEFKTGTGSIAYDTSGIDPAMNLNFFGDVSWYGGWGITIGNGAAGPGKAQASTVASKKIHDILSESGEFSIEAWVVPANVSQEMARIMSYSSGQASRNFTLQQTLYNYDFLLRTNAVDTNDNPVTSLNGDPQLSTPDDDEVLQATLQHVVATYDPVNGRRIYVNGTLATQTDPIPGGTFSAWQDNMAFILGNEASSDGLWEGTFRLAAVHRRALSQEQINQNFDAGVGERFYLLFDISERIGLTPQTAYILFQAQQFDSYAYLFDQPHFITLDGSTPTPVQMQGLRIAMNGKEARVGQSFANIDQTLDLANAVLTELGQPLSELGAVLPLEKGPDADQFFLTFDYLDGAIFNRLEDPMLVVADYLASDEERRSDIGVRTFDEIDATYAAITGVNRVSYQDANGNFVVEETYQELRQSLPAIEDIGAFLSSHQVAIAQLAIQYCDAAVEANTIWTGADFVDFDAAPGTTFAIGSRDTFVKPLIERAVGHSPDTAPITSQPSYTVVHEEVALFAGAGNRPQNLIDRLLQTPGTNTRSIAKGVCASVLGSAATLVQ